MQSFLSAFWKTFYLSLRRVFIDVLRTQSNIIMTIKNIYLKFKLSMRKCTEKLARSLLQYKSKYSTTVTAGNDFILISTKINYFLM